MILDCFITLPTLAFRGEEAEPPLFPLVVECPPLHFTMIFNYSINTKNVKKRTI